MNHINNINKSHPSIDELVNTASQPTDDGTGNENNNNLANTFAEKIKSAIASKTNNSHTPPSVKSYEKTPKKKITTLPQQTNIHPAIVTTQQPQQPYEFSPFHCLILKS
ncbi:MAG: hypothetical protein GY755_02170 [Chloroflexi bacterium]|nr:hypothetical protein [Chloroflexota bacterium]